MKSFTIKIAIIHWTDSTYFKVEESIGNPETLKPRNLISVGILIHEDKDFISICQDMETKKEGNRMVISIPKVSIISKEIFMKKIKIEGSAKK
jgi:hypothetical protein